MGRSVYHLHRSAAAEAVSRLPTWPPCWDLVVSSAAPEALGFPVPGTRLRPLRADVDDAPPVVHVSADQASTCVDREGPTSPRRVGFCPPFQPTAHDPSLSLETSSPYLPASPRSRHPAPHANPAGRRNDEGEASFPREVLSWPPSFSPTPSLDPSTPSFSAHAPTQNHGHAEISPEPPSADRSVASTCGLGSAAASTRTYKDALLSSPPPHRSPPSPRRLLFSPVKGKDLCFRCLSPEHFVGGCRDPLRCKACGRFGHRKKGCELPPLSYSRSAPSLSSLVDPCPLLSPRLRRLSSAAASPETPCHPDGALLLQAYHSGLRRGFLVWPPTPYPR
jgi:hypothetical protein